jgi:phosphotransferase family enzyme
MCPADPHRSREADWRFLLPTAGLERVGDVTDQRLARQLPHTAEPDAAATVELAVGTDPTRRQLEQAFGSLQPGGVAYFEWRSALRPTVGMLRRRLEAAGFVDVRLYWSWPRENPSVWVPLDAPAAARWVIRRRRKRAASRAWRLANAARLLRPSCATAFRSPPAEETGPLGSPLGGLDGRPFWALLAPGSDPLNKVLAFVGVDGGDEPALVLKLPRTAAAMESLGREADVLQALHSSGTAPAGVPRLLFSHQEGAAVRAIAESPLEGRPLLGLLDRRSYADLAARATDWLIQLARVKTGMTERRTAVEAAPAAEAELPPADRQLLLDAGRIAAAADTLPVVFEQRDFSPWNVHVDRRGSLVVFDWESAEPHGFPALDLVYFLAYCGFFLDRALESGRARESYRATFQGDVARECLSRYLEALEVDLAHLPALRTLTWLVHLRSALRREGAAQSAALFLDLLREEVQ